MNKYQEALELLKEYRIVEELRIVDKVNYNARLEKIIDLLQELVDKATPKKPIDNSWSFSCPNCENLEVINNGVGYKYCRHCGQALDWSKDEI